MYLRLKKLNPADLEEGEEILMMAVQQKGGAKSTIVSKPCQLEWWDGIDWHPVRFVEVDDETEPV